MVLFLIHLRYWDVPRGDGGQCPYTPISDTGKQRGECCAGLACGGCREEGSPKVVFIGMGVCVVRRGRNRNR